jgi:tryptophan 2,3-dioxygenase
MTPPQQRKPNGPYGHGAAGHDGPVLPGQGASDYERYMRVDELLALQKKPSEMAHPDEMLFATIHQSFELWMRLVRFELTRIAERIDADDFHTAVRWLRRIRKAVHANTTALAVFDTMVPQEFHEVRRQLGRGSGAESPGFRALLAEAPQLWPHVEALMQRNETNLERIYTEQGHRPDLFGLFEAMTDFDQSVAAWRQAHLSVVRRIIGQGVKSLKGYAVEQLREDITRPLWPALWNVREAVTHFEGTSPA